MWTIINLAANLAITFQIVYLYTCGQGYMKLLAVRRCIDFSAERIVLSTLACVAFSNAILATTPGPTEILLNMFVATYIAFTIISIIKKFK